MISVSRGKSTAAKVLSVALLLSASACRELSEPSTRSNSSDPGNSGDLGSTSAAVGSGTYAITASADAYVRSDAANKNYGPNDSLRILKQGTSGANRAFVSISQSQVADSVGLDSLVSASITVAIKRTGTDWGSTGRYVGAYRVTKAWTEAGVTWSCAVDGNVSNSTKDCTGSASWTAAGGDHSSSSTGQVKIVNSQAGSLSIDVTADVRAFLAGTSQNYGWLVRLVNEAQTGTIVFRSREGTIKPKLVLTTVPRPVLTPQPPDSIPKWIFADTNIAAPNAAIGVSFMKRIVVVQFKSGTTEAQRQTAFSAIAGTVVGGMRAGTEEGQYYVKVNDIAGGILLTAAQTLRARAEVRYAFVNIAAAPQFRRPADGNGWAGSANWRVRVSGIDPSLQTWALTAINAPMAWGCWTGDNTARVAIVDVDFRSSQSQFADLNYMSRRTGAGPLFIAPHGASVAGLVAGRGNNGVGLTGVLWDGDVRLYDFSSTFTSQTTDWVGPAVFEIEHAARDGAQVINLSQSMPVEDVVIVGQGSAAQQASRDEFHAALKGAMQSMAYYGRTPLMIIAAGNSKHDAMWSGYPMVRDDFPNQVIVVGGTTSTGALWADATRGSSVGSYVDVMAPGKDVYAYGSDGIIAKQNGTSLSAPLVSGIAGLLFSFDSRLTTADVRQLILDGAVRGNRVLIQGGKSTYIVDAYESLKLAAERVGAPLCGNRVWGQSGQVKVSRGALAPEAIITAGDTMWNVNARHGGRTLSFEARNLGSAYYKYIAASHSWAAMGTEPTEASSGATRSTALQSHDGDTTMTVTDPTMGGASSIVLKLFTGGIEVKTVSVPVSAPPITVFSYCFAYDANGCIWPFQRNDGEYWYVQAALWSSDAKAVVAASRISTVTAGGAGSATTTQGAVSATIYLVDFVSGTYQTLGDLPGNIVYGLAIAEGEAAFAVAKGGLVLVDTSPASVPGDIQVHATNCTLEYRSFAFTPLLFSVGTPDPCAGSAFLAGRPGVGTFSAFRTAATTQH